MNYCKHNSSSYQKFVPVKIPVTTVYAVKRRKLLHYKCDIIGILKTRMKLLIDID